MPPSAPTRNQRFSWKTHFSQNRRLSLLSEWYPLMGKFKIWDRHSRMKPWDNHNRGLIWSSLNICWGMILGVCYFFYSPKNGIMTPISNDRLFVISVSPFENCFREKRYARTLCFETGFWNPSWGCHSLYSNIWTWKCIFANISTLTKSWTIPYTQTSIARSLWNPSKDPHWDYPKKTNKRDDNLFFIIQIQNSKTHLPRNLIRIDIPRVPSSSLEVPEFARWLLTRGTVDTA